MPRLSRKYKRAISKIDRENFYTLKEACELVKKTSSTSFDASIDLALRLGVDPRKANEMVRGVVTLPHGTGKQVRVLALVTADKEKEAKEAGADYVGLDEYLEKIKKGWTDIDVIVTNPPVMGKLGPLGRILGPRGLMPNPKTGTVSTNIKRAITDIKKGKIDFRVDKTGIVHASIGKVSFDEKKIYENAHELINAVVKMKPSGSKGVYLKSLYMSSTMGPGIPIEPRIS